MISSPARDLVQQVQACFPDLTINANQYGKLLSLSLYNHVESYAIDAVENEVGVTYREQEGELDFAGSDVAFPTLELAIDFLVGFRERLKKNLSV